MKDGYGSDEDSHIIIAINTCSHWHRIFLEITLRIVQYDEEPCHIIAMNATIYYTRQSIYAECRDRPRTNLGCILGCTTLRRQKGKIHS